MDTDALIEKTAGRSIPEIFAGEGEPYFRELEADALRLASLEEEVVIAVGGGAALRPGNRRLMGESGFIVCLEATPETIFRRLTRGEEGQDRPLLSGPDPLALIKELKASRQALYAFADFTIHTDNLSPDEAASQIVQAWRRSSTQAMVDSERQALSGPLAIASPNPLQGAAATVSVAGGSYPIFVQWDALFDLGARLREAGLTGQTYLISDDNVFPLYWPQIEAVLQQAGIPVVAYSVPAGEASKSLSAAAKIYDWLVERKAERGHTVLALGGGMVTDLAGYVAATFARGLPLAHIPTSLLGMVDAAIGGKVAVNHPRAKNLIGAFYQPRFVLADIATLRTLPEREYISGWAEVIKHALIDDEALLRDLEENAGHALKLQPDVLTRVISRSVAIKARVVSQDEREITGLRTMLNYGHTLAHALESAGSYDRFLHGEAVAIGMMAAAVISRELGMIPPEAVERQRSLLVRFGLPVQADGLERGQLMESMALDKKVENKAIRWVLLQGFGKPVVRNDVPLSVVETALDEALR